MHGENEGDVSYMQVVLYCVHSLTKNPNQEAAVSFISHATVTKITIYSIPLIKSLLFKTVSTVNGNKDET